MALCVGLRNVPFETSCGACGAPLVIMLDDRLGDTMRLTYHLLVFSGFQEKGSKSDHFQHLLRRHGSRSSSSTGRIEKRNLWWKVPVQGLGREVTTSRVWMASEGRVPLQDGNQNEQSRSERCVRLLFTYGVDFSFASSLRILIRTTIASIPGSDRTVH